MTISRVSRVVFWLSKEGGETEFYRKIHFLRCVQSGGMLQPPNLEQWLWSIPTYEQLVFHCIVRPSTLLCRQIHVPITPPPKFLCAHLRHDLLGTATTNPLFCVGEPEDIPPHRVRSDPVPVMPTRRNGRRKMRLARCLVIFEPCL